MEKNNTEILEIKACYKERINHLNKKENKSFSGHIILSKDLWFEGIITDEDSKIDEYVTGSLLDLKGIFLMKLPEQGNSLTSFFGITVEDLIRGRVAVHDLESNVHEVGSFALKIANIKEEKNITSQLETKINKFKDNVDVINWAIIDGLIKPENKNMLSDYYLKLLDRQDENHSYTPTKKIERHKGNWKN